MTERDAGEAARLKEQTRAIDIHRPGGAVISHNYLERQQEIVGVNRTDLEDIMQFDEMAAWFVSTGVFFLSGAIWLAVDRLTTEMKFSPTVAICGISILFGGILLLAGFILHQQKRGRISRIFEETRPSKRRSRGH